jgi:hypothetical protein
MVDAPAGKKVHCLTHPEFMFQHFKILQSSDSMTAGGLYRNTRGLPGASACSEPLYSKGTYAIGAKNPKGKYCVSRCGFKCSQNSPALVFGCFATTFMGLLLALALR